MERGDILGHKPMRDVVEVASSINVWLPGGANLWMANDRLWEEACRARFAQALYDRITSAAGDFF